MRGSSLKMIIVQGTLIKTGVTHPKRSLYTLTTLQHMTLKHTACSNRVHKGKFNNDGLHFTGALLQVDIYHGQTLVAGQDHPGFLIGFLKMMSGVNIPTLKVHI